MTFRVESLPNYNYEVVMEKGTVWRGHERRIAFCTHKNDADTICGLLNEAEKNGTLRKD